MQLNYVLKDENINPGSISNPGVRSLGVGEVGVGGKESLVPDIVGYGVFSVPKLVLVC